MNRRDFLKLSSLVTVAAGVAGGAVRYWTTLPVEAAAFGKVFRGTYDGSIHVSPDGGQSWQLHSHLGSSYSILDIFTGLDGRLYVHTGFEQHAFHLVLSKDQDAWLSEAFSTDVLLAGSGPA